MTTQFRSHQGAWRVASTEQFDSGQLVTVSRRNGRDTEVIITGRVAHDPARDLPYLYSFEDVRRASGAQPQARTVALNTAQAERLFALFERANSAARTQNNRHAGLAVRFGLTNTTRGLRLEMAGANSRYNGQLLALADQRTSTGRRTLYGSMHRNGAFTGNVGATQIELEIFNEVADVLTRFAADPAGYAAAHGHATGNCCFCGRGLTDERSVAVGYGPICADYFGLPWGDATHAPAFDVAQGSRRQMERLADNAGRENAFDHLPPATSQHVNAQGEIINRTLHGIETAAGEALDRWAAQYGVSRAFNTLDSTHERDESLRRRILAAARRIALPEHGPFLHRPDEAANDSVPTLEDIQNEPNAFRRMAMAAQRASAGQQNVMRDSMGRIIVVDTREDGASVGVVDVQRDPSDPNRMTATVTAPVREGQVVTTVRRVRPAAAPAATPATTAGASVRSAVAQARAERATPVPTDETVTTVVRAVRRPPNSPLEEDDFVWPPRNTGS